MGLFTELPEGINPDVIIAGGGTAGCIIAARLAQADRSLVILVIEGGKSSKGMAAVEIPALFIAGLVPETGSSIFYKGRSSGGLDDKLAVVPAGAVLGGGSSINFMMYTRPQRSDFDSWDIPGWTTDELIPYFKKFETYHGPDPAGRHGTEGPIQVSDGTFRSLRCEDAFVAAAQKVGFPEMDDLQGLDGSVNGVQRAKRYISPDGKRQDTASRYLYPLLEDGQYPNLHVLVQHQVIRVLFDGTRATGVEYRPNPAYYTESGGSKRGISARKMVIVSSGAIGTPLILERSGVGDPALLSQASIPVVSALPGVGNSYQDHNLLLYPYRSSLSPEETLDALYDGRSSVTEAAQTHPALLGWNAQDVTCKFRPRDGAEVATLGPEFAAAWERDFAPNPDRPLMMMSLVDGYGSDRSILSSEPRESQYFSISTFSTYPYSRGQVHIKPSSSSLDTIYADIDFSPGFMSDKRDVKMLTWGYKIQREIARRMECYRGEIAACHPPFPAASAAACGQRDGPVKEYDPPIRYSEDDEKVLETWAMQNAGTTWHPIGTCPMRPKDQGGVVDNRLGVFGVTGLKIADLSIAPGNVAANTGSTALLIGEKAADMFAAELRQLEPT